MFKGLMLIIGLLIFSTNSFSLDNLNTDLNSIHFDKTKYKRVIPEIEFYNASLNSVFLTLSKYSGIDIVSGVKGKYNVTLSLTKKSWQQVLQIVCKINKLTPLVSDEHIYVVTTADYNQMILNDAQTNQQLKSIAPLMVQIIKINNSTASEMSSSIAGFLSKRGKTTVVEKTNSIIVMDTKENIEEIKKIIAKLDTETPEVMIEVRLVTVDHDKLRNLGINWTTLLTNTSTGAATELLKLATNTVSGKMLDVNVPNTNLSASLGGFSVGMSDVSVGFISSVADAKVVASPQITTMDNKEAHIFMGEKVPIRSLDGEGKATTKMVDAGTELTVTPHITLANKILMDLEPKKKSYSVDQLLGQPIFKEQSAKTTVQVEDGETIVIGGLTTREETEAVSGIPGLRSIPFIGALFRSKRVSVKNLDLIIFVTPHIIKNHKKEDIQSTDLGVKVGETSKTSVK